MVKRREPKATTQSPVKPEPTAEQIEAFADGVDGESNNPTIRILDQNEPRKFKTMSVPFNEYEYDQLLKGAKLTGRSKLNFMRHAMLTMAKELQEEDNN